MLTLLRLYICDAKGCILDFSREGRGGGVTLCQGEVTHQIIMSTSTPATGCLLKKAYKGGGGGGVTGTPGLPSYIPDA